MDSDQREAEGKRPLRRGLAGAGDRRGASGAGPDVPFMPGVPQDGLPEPLRPTGRLQHPGPEPEPSGSEARLTPHFLFNSLNAVRELLRREDAAAAEEMVLRLSELLRTVLAVQERREITLLEEIDLVRRYVEVERIRFGSDLALRVDLDPGTEGWPVPPLLIQPLVENAIRHGLAGRRGGGTIEIRALLRLRRAELEIRDDGRGLPDDWSPDRVGTGIGSARARLVARYGSDHRFHICRRDGGGTRVSLTLPWRRPVIRP